MLLLYEALYIIVLGPIPPPSLPPSLRLHPSPTTQRISNDSLLHVCVDTRVHMLLHVIAGFET